MPVRFTAVLALCIAGMSGCGDSRPSAAPTTTVSAPTTTVSAHPAPDPGLLHIHGLGLSEGRLFIATHTGMWVADAGQTKARRLGTSRQDVMGFSVLSDRRFLGSGHPGPGEQLPPNLGLIRSTNSGGSWKSISLMGEADFHVLVSAGRRVYGYDGAAGRLMVSSDGGRRWTSRSAPPMLSLAIDPGSADRFVASTGEQLLTSDDAGRTLRLAGPVNRVPAGFLAWPRRRAMYVVNGGGEVARSRDGGTSFTRVGAVGGRPSAFVAAGSALYVALEDGSVKVSPDGGRTWAVRTRP